MAALAPRNAMTGRLAVAAVVVLSLPVLAGCLTSGSQAPSALAPARAAPNVWEAGLADAIATPDVAARRSAAERGSDLSPPGAPEFASFDAAVEAFMAEQGIPTASIALMRDGRLRYERGYGHLDQALTKDADAKTMFRIASVTKPMTAALVGLQVEQGLYAWEDPVFCLGAEPRADCRVRIEPHPARPVVDARLADIQVQHLVAHMGGWDRAITPEPFWGGKPIEIAEELGVPTPPPAWRIVQWMMGEELDHDPGTTFAYCNICYVLLGLVAESATGAGLPALYDAYLLRPLEVQGDIEPGHSLVERRNPREPFYFCEGGEQRNVYDPSEKVCYPDGGFDLDGVLGAGGLVATAAAVAAIYEVYDGRCTLTLVEPGTCYVDGHNGGLPGTATIARTIREGIPGVGEVQVVALFNRNGPSHPGVGTLAYQFERPLLALAAAWAASENARTAPASAEPLGPWG